MSHPINMPPIFPFLGYWWSCFLLQSLFYSFFKANLIEYILQKHSYIPPDGTSPSLPKEHCSLMHAQCIHLLMSQFSHSYINSSVQRCCILSWENILCIIGIVQNCVEMSWRSFINYFYTMYISKKEINYLVLKIKIDCDKLIMYL